MYLATSRSIAHVALAAVIQIILFIICIAAVNISITRENLDAVKELIKTPGIEIVSGGIAICYFYVKVMHYILTPIRVPIVCMTEHCLAAYYQRISKLSKEVIK